MLPLLAAIPTLLSRYWIYLVVAASIGGFLGYQQWKIKSRDLMISDLKQTIKDKDKLIFAQEQSIKSYEVSLKNSQDEIEKLQQSIETDRKLRKQIEDKYKQQETELAQLKENYDDVKKYLNTRIPERLVNWLRQDTKGELENNTPSKGDKKTTAKRVSQRLRKKKVRWKNKRRLVQVYKRPEQVHRQL